ncbi:MAG: beta-glucosidase [Acidimicrobiales bacterium]
MSDTTDRLQQLTLAEKCALVAGASNWRTPPIERVGVPAVKMTDGPNGARGEGSVGESTPGVLVPVGIAQGATWDPGLIGQVGDLLGRETRRRTSHVLLAPAVNLHRTPVGGRTFEYYSEDPELTARLAVEYVRGVQSHGVAATVKHFVANDTEVERHTVNVEVDQRVLRELYLVPFEACVREAGAWAVMSAYNQLGGEFCAANAGLLRGVLRDEWGFDGAVMSDWYGAHDTVGSADGGLSIEMPGPPRIYGDHLVDAVERGEVDEATVDGLVADVLGLIERTRADERSADEPEESVDDPDERELCRQVAVAGTVLARNVDGALPLDAGSSPSVAVIGPNAADTRIQGGGSSALRPLPHRSIVEALRGHLPDLVHERGVTIDKGTPLAPLDRFIGPDGEPGLELTIHEGTEPGGAVQYTRRTNGLVRWFGSMPDGVVTPCLVSVRGAYVPEVSGPHEFGLIASGRPGCRIGEIELARAGERLPEGEAFYGMGSSEQLGTVEAIAGEPIPVELELEVGGPFAAIRLGVRPPVDETMFDRAVQAAESAEVAVVVVGTSEEWETEGHDRTTIDLPGRQDELVSAVAAVCDRTVVVVNAGAPVAMPWVDDVEAVLLPFFGGMEMAGALADILVGHADPGGRLPTTFPRRLEDSPAWEHYAPVDGVQRYGEGLHMGYRGHDRNSIEPLFAFGHGLSYGEAAWGEPSVSAASIEPGGSVSVSVPVAAGAERSATVVVQGYVAPVDPPVEREVKALRTWAKSVVSAGTTTTVELVFGPEAFRRWDDAAHGWTIDPGHYDLVIAASATDIRSTARVELSSH